MKVHMIYLAAGNSHRFGSNKLLYHIQGIPLYRYGLHQLLKVLKNHENYTLDVVTQYDEIMTYIKNLSYHHLDCIKSVHSHLGLSYSIHAGIQKYAQEKDCYFLFLVADQPYIQSRTIENMIDEVLKSNSLLATVKYQQNFGNPTLFHCQFYDELMHLTGDQGGRKVIQRYQEQCFIYPIPQQELIDIDYLEDLKCK